ncbi:Protein-lysine methyltransferase, partial [Actinidia chinensis var. chinensis]
MRHQKHHLLLSAQQQEPQRPNQRIVEVIVIHYVRSQYQIVISPNRFEVVDFPPTERRHVDYPAVLGHSFGVGFGVELEVWDHVREIGHGDVGTEGCGGGDADEAGSGSELQDAEAATGWKGGESGSEGASGRVRAVVVEEGDEGGSCGPELEGEALGAELPDLHRRLDRSE